MSVMYTQMGSRWLEAGIARFGVELGGSVVRAWTIIAERAASHPRAIAWQLESGQVQHHVDERTCATDWERWRHLVETHVSMLAQKHPGLSLTELGARLEDDARASRMWHRGTDEATRQQAAGRVLRAFDSVLIPSCLDL